MNKLKVEIERRFPDQLLHILQSVGFWNEQGQHIYDKNKAGLMGSYFSQNQARKVSYEEFVFNSLLSEMQTFSEGIQYWAKGYKFGRGAYHVWISNADNQRVLFIHF